MKLFAFAMLLMSAAFLAVCVLATNGRIDLSNQDLTPFLVVYAAIMLAYVVLTRRKLKRTGSSRRRRRSSGYALASILGITRLW